MDRERAEKARRDRSRTPNSPLVLTPRRGDTGITDSMSVLPEGGQLPRYLAAIRANQTLSRRLDLIGQTTTARALRDCQTVLTLHVCDHCHSHQYIPVNCKRRLCAVCEPRKARKNAALALALFAKAREPRWLTLTMTRAPKLAEGIARIRRAFRAWRRGPIIRKLIRSGFYQIEAKPKPDGWHVHLHCLLDSRYLPWQTVERTWARALEQETSSIWIERVNGRKVVEYVTKYAMKPGDYAKMTDAQLAEIAATIHKARLTGAWGEWYQATLATVNELPEPARHVCPVCQTPNSCYPARAGPRIWGDVWEHYRAKYWPTLETNTPNVEVLTMLQDSDPSPEPAPWDAFATQDRHDPPF